MLKLTTTYTDQFTPSANPLNPANWTTFAGDGALQAVAVGAAPGYCRAATLTPSGAYLSSLSLPANQFVSVTLQSLTVGSLAGFDLYTRSDGSTANCYFLNVTDNGDGTVSIIIGSVVSGTESDLTTLASVAFANGDTFGIAVVGTSIFALHNGAQIGTAVNNQVGSGFVAVDIVPLVSASTDVRLAALTAGSASIGSGGTGLNDENFRFLF